MSKIQIKQLRINQSEFKELNDKETRHIIGGNSKISSKEMIQIAMQKALNRSDINLNSNSSSKKTTKI
jgi:bacteriocin-like protein